MSNNLMQPFIKLKQAQCYDCMIPIRIYESEANDIELSLEGHPRSVTQIRYKLIGVCPKCGRKYMVDRINTSFEITSILKKYLDKEEVDNYDERVINKHSTNCNEFGYVTPNNRRS